MFPIPWNKEYRKKDGTLVKISDAMGGGGGSDLPPHSSSDAGKVLKVADDGSLEWDASGSGGGWIFDTLLINGLICDTNEYKTANLDKTIDFDDYDFIAILLKSDSGVLGLSAAFNSGRYRIVGRSVPGVTDFIYNVELSSTTIKMVSYTGNFYNVYADIYGVTI